MKKQLKSPPKPKPKPNLDFRESAAQDRRLLEKNMARYNCTLDEELSEETRLFGIERHQNVCQVVDDAVRDFIHREREKQRQDN